MKKYIGLAMALMFALSVGFVSVASANSHGHEEKVECHEGHDAHGHPCEEHEEHKAHH